MRKWLLSLRCDCITVVQPAESRQVVVATFASRRATRVDPINTSDAGTCPLGGSLKQFHGVRAVMLSRMSMTRFLCFVGFALLAVGSQSAQQIPSRGSSSGFQEPRIAEASDIKYPPNSIANGTVVIKASIDDLGRVQDVKVICDVVSLSPAAVEAVKSWKFRPATLAGKPIPSSVSIAVVFNPALDNPPKAFLTCASRGPDEQTQDQFFSPPQALEVVYPRYPIQSVAAGTVVLELTVNPVGEVENVRILRDIPSLTNNAVETTKNWRFRSAALNGRSVPSTTVVAFLFRRPPFPNTR